MILLDTNIVSQFIRLNAASKAPRLVAFVTQTLLTEGLSISSVTQFELRRGIEELVRRGEARTKLVNYEKFLERVMVYDFDGVAADVASRLWAEGRSKKPALVFTDADLMIAATAASFGHEFATSESGLVEGLAKLAFPVPVRHVAAE